MPSSNSTFEPPGPGSWDLDPLHFPRPVTAYWAEMHPEPFSLGYADMTAFYGAPFQTRLTAYVNGFCYGQMQPVPPEAFPDRVQRAAEVFERKAVARAGEGVAGGSQAGLGAGHTTRSRRSIPTQLSDEELVDYLRRCRDHHASMIRQHMAFTGTAVIPPGDFLAHARQWTGLPTVKLLGLMRGASLISGGGSPQHAALVAAYRADPAAREALDSDEDPGALLERLRARTQRDRPGAERLPRLRRVPAARRVRHLEPLRARDARRPAALHPHRDRRDGVGLGRRPARSPRSAATCRRSTARSTTRCLRRPASATSVRDERGVYCDIWASGLMRRAALAAGRRLAATWASARCRALRLRGHRRDVRAARGRVGADGATSWPRGYTYHQTYTAKDAPVHLGDDPPPMPDPSALPPPMARLMAALGTAMGEMFGGLGGGARGDGDPRPRRQLRHAGGDRPSRRRSERTSTASSRATSCSPRRPPRPSTSCCRCSARSSPTAAVPCRTRRSSRGSTASPVSSAPATPPTRIADGTRVRVDGDAGTVTVLE